MTPQEYTRIKKYARRRFRTRPPDQVEDIIQEMCIEYVTNIQEYVHARYPVGCFLGYRRRRTWQGWLRAWKKLDNPAYIEDRSIEDPLTPATIEDWLTQQEYFAELNALINELPSMDACLVRMPGDKTSYSLLSEMHGKPPKYFSVRRSRILNKLRKRLGGPDKKMKRSKEFSKWKEEHRRPCSIQSCLTTEYVGGLCERHWREARS